MTEERWRRVADLYDAAQSKTPDDRTAFLREASAGDSGLRREVESLLAQDDTPAVLDASLHHTVNALFSDNPGVPFDSSSGHPEQGRGVHPGALVGPYRVDALLGVGGMGEVYRARDTKLNRDVAIKILPPAFASDPDRLARFKREAQVLAALNHPHIAAIHGLEGQEGRDGQEGKTFALVMELVDGPTLADRIAHGALPLDEVLAIARQIADALEAAHEQGIVHRDLKPANIKVREDGTVKVLDFGLAKIAESGGGGQAGRAGGENLTQSPTITTPAMTAAGMILGTAAYMSPEQAKGKPADSRSDIWAFGCVLYEMLTGTRPFNGEDVADTMAAVLRGDPDWTRLPPGTPLSILRLLRRSLEKDRKRRLPHIGVARSEIDDAGIAAPAIASAASHADGRGRERLLWAAGLVLVAALAAVGALVTRPSSARPAETRLDIATPPTSDPASIAISPDGRRIVFVAEVENQPRLWIRDLGTGAVKALARTEGASYPFWSPDNRSVAFFTDRGQLMRIDLDGETVRPIARAGLGRGGAWGPDGTILYAENALQVIKKVGADGGVPASVTTFREGDASHSFPRFLPDGKHFLFFIAGAPNDTGIFVADLDGTAPRRLVDADAAGTYAAGHLFYVKQGRLFAQMMDPSTNTLSGAPAPVADQVAVVGGASNVPALSVSTDGTIVYRSGEARNIRQLEWVDRTGALVASIDEPDRFFPTNPALSHDDRWLAVTRIQSGNGDIWTFDLANGAKRTRFTTDPRAETYPMWSPDGERLVFTRNSNLVMANMSTRSEETLLDVAGLSLRTGSILIANDWSAVDGGTLIVRSSSQVGNDQYAAVTGYDLYALSVATRQLTPVATTNANEREGQFSPDGKWIAFQSDASGRYEIYLQRFPEGTDNVVVSRTGGAQVRWNSNGKELFYVDLSGQLMAAPISTQGGRAEPGMPKALFSTHVGGLMAVFRAQYAVSRDGQRFLMNSVVNTVNTTPISVVLNWAGLNRADATRAPE